MLQVGVFGMLTPTFAAMYLTIGRTPGVFSSSNLCAPKVMVLRTDARTIGAAFSK